MQTINTHTHTHRKSLIFEMIKSITQQPVPIVTFQLLFKSIVIQTYEASKDRPVFYISFIRKSFRNTGTLKKKKKKGKPFPSHIKGLFSKTIIVSFSRIGRAMTPVRELLIFSLFVATSIGLPSKSHRGSHGYPIPPEPRNQGNFEVGYDHVEIGKGKFWKRKYKEKGNKKPFTLFFPCVDGIRNVTTFFPLQRDESIRGNLRIRKIYGSSVVFTRVT